MSIPVRPLNPDLDLDAVRRIWLDCGWIEPSDEHKAGLRRFLRDGSGWVAEVRGTPEALAYGTPGDLLHTGTTLPAHLVAAVTASRLVRGRGLAGAVTARLVADAAEQGAAVAYLGFFEQGYYNQLGFGNGNYFRFATIDPQHLDVPKLRRYPVRLTVDDVPRMHAGRVARRRLHGAFTEHSPGAMAAEFAWTEGGFALGFEADDGRISHHLFVAAKGEEGPYTVKWLAYETAEQMVELLSLIASWREQVLGVRIYDPPGFQLQDFVRFPLRQQWARRKGDFAVRPEAFTWWQARALDLPRLVGAVEAVEPLRFAVSVHDPIAAVLARCEQVPDWTGVAGDYVVSLGATSEAERGAGADLPRLTASVGALTRLLLGVSTARSLAVCDELSGAPELLDAVDRALRLPAPNIDWEL